MATSEVVPRSTTPRGVARRELIIAVATDLFHNQGFHVTGMDEIGEAAGITGPGVYRHFVGKDEILMAIFDRIWVSLLDHIDAARDLPARDALDVLISGHVEIAVERRAEGALLLRELINLPDSYQELAERNDALYVDAWARPLVALGQGLTADEARLTARSVFWMINAYDAEPIATRISKERSKALLVTLANAAIDGL